MGVEIAKFVEFQGLSAILKDLFKGSKKGKYKHMLKQDKLKAV